MRRRATRSSARASSPRAAPRSPRGGLGRRSPTSRGRPRLPAGFDARRVEARESPPASTVWTGQVVRTDDARRCEELLGEPLVGADVARRLVAPRQDVDDALPPVSPHAPAAVRDRPGARAIARAYAATSFGSTYVAALSAETRVSFRSNATTGSSNAMYSIVLFIVETSFRGLSGSGHSPRSAVESTSDTTSSGTRPGEGDPVRDPELFCELDQLCGAVSFAHQDELDVVPSRTRELGGGVEREIDAVLRAHDTEVRAQVPTARAASRDWVRRGEGDRGPGPSERPSRRSRQRRPAGWPCRDTSRSSRSRDPRPRRSPARGGGAHGAERANRSGTVTRTPRGRGRAGRRRTSLPASLNGRASAQ